MCSSVCRVLIIPVCWVYFFFFFSVVQRQGSYSDSNRTFLSFCLSVSHSQMLSNCCLSVSGEEIPIRAPLVDYDRQVAGSGCPIDAIVWVLLFGLDVAAANGSWRESDAVVQFCVQGRSQALHRHRCSRGAPSHATCGPPQENLPEQELRGGSVEVNEKMLNEIHFPN